MLSLRWTQITRQIIHFHFLGLRLTRSKEDVCDACVRIETQHLCTGISDQLREKLLLENSMHIEATIGQQHAMSDFVKLFVKKVAPGQVLPKKLLHNCIDSEEHSLERVVVVENDLNTLPIPSLLIQVEDFGENSCLATLWIQPSIS